MAPTNGSSVGQRKNGKAPKASVARYLSSIEPKLVEGVKPSLLLKGTKCSATMKDILCDFRMLKSPHSKLMQKNNDIHPFEDPTSIEFLTTKNDSPTFAIGSTNKKRPNNLIMGRTYDGQVLDLVEMGVTEYKGIADYKGGGKKRLGSKPMFLFVGDGWEQDASLKKVQNLMIDWFRGEPIDKLSLIGLDHVIVLTTTPTENKITFRTYHVRLKKDPKGDRVPVPLLTSCGPDMDLEIRRTQFASADLWKESLKQPKELKIKKKRNQETNTFGETTGRLHLEKQDLAVATGRKTKALRDAERADKLAEKQIIEAELEREERDNNKRDFGFDLPGDDNEVGSEGEEEGEKRRGGKKTKRRRKR